MNHHPIDDNPEEFPVQMSAAISAEEGIAFRLLVQALPLAVFVCTNRNIQYMNPAGDALLGSEEIEDVLDQDFLQFVHTRDSGAVAEMLERPNTPGDSVVWKSVRIGRRDGGNVPVELAATDIGNGCVQLVARKLPVRNLHRFTADRKWGWKTLHDTMGKTR